MRKQKKVFKELRSVTYKLQFLWVTAAARKVEWLLQSKRFQWGFRNKYLLKVRTNKW